MSISSYVGESAKHLAFLSGLKMKFLEREGNVMRDDPLGVMRDAASTLLFDVHGGNACFSFGFLRVPS